MKMAIDEEVDGLPDRDAAKGFYARYEPKEILGRGGCSVVRRCIGKAFVSVFVSFKYV